MGNLSLFLAIQIWSFNTQYLKRALYEGFWRNDKHNYGRLLITNGNMYEGDERIK